MKKAFSLILALCILAGLSAPASAAPFHRNAVYEYYSAEGFYVDSIGNTWSYSYHVPQIFAYSPAADEINAEIAERFAKPVEHQFEVMLGRHSLSMWNTEWHAYWNGTQLFLLVSSTMDSDITDCCAYGYDFETENRITNEMILDQLGISEEEYLENLEEKVRLMFEDAFRSVPAEKLEDYGYSDLLSKTLSWLDMEQPMYIDGTGEIVTIVKIASAAGAGWYYHYATPFAYG